MILKLLDYMSMPHEFTVNLPDVLSIDIEVVSGDEIANVLFKDGHTERFDSCPDGRLTDFDDGGYVLYSPEQGIDKFDLFNIRTDSYDMFMALSASPTPMTNADKFKEVFGVERKGSCTPFVFGDDCVANPCSRCEDWWNAPYEAPKGEEDEDD